MDQGGMGTSPLSRPHPRGRSFHTGSLGVGCPPWSPRATISKSGWGDYLWGALVFVRLRNIANHVKSNYFLKSLKHLLNVNLSASVCGLAVDNAGAFRCQTLTIHQDVLG